MTSKGSAWITTTLAPASLMKLLRMVHKGRSTASFASKGTPLFQEENGLKTPPRAE
jgi:hypothetical protein